MKRLNLLLLALVTLALAFAAPASAQTEGPGIFDFTKRGLVSLNIGGRWLESQGDHALRVPGGFEALTHDISVGLNAAHDFGAGVGLSGGVHYWRDAELIEFRAVLTYTVWQAPRP